LRLAGLLNPDVRTRERSKVGQWLFFLFHSLENSQISQPGARAKYIWKKRWTYLVEKKKERRLNSQYLLIPLFF
jgi:hypothetical protein